jgi:hypothetical protein
MGVVERVFLFLVYLVRVECGFIQGMIDVEIGERQEGRAGLIWRSVDPLR